MTITKLSETSGDQVRTLLENCGIKSIKERAGRFDIECPSCKKTEAFIEYKHDKRWIKCNRNNNCAYNQSLWHLIAEKQGILEGDKVQMLEYINYTLGQDFIKKESKEPITHSVQESVIEDQEFLNHCNQIFKNSFQQKNSELNVSLKYLKNRGYSDEHIQSFNLGYLVSERKGRFFEKLFKNCRALEIIFFIKLKKNSLALVDTTILHKGNKLQALAAGDDFMNLHETPESATKFAGWRKEKPTKKQREWLPSQFKRVRKITKGDAGAILTYQMQAQSEIRNVLSCVA